MKRDWSIKTERGILIKDFGKGFATQNSVERFFVIAYKTRGLFYKLDEIDWVKRNCQPDSKLATKITKWTFTTIRSLQDGHNMIWAHS